MIRQSEKSKWIKRFKECYPKGKRLLAVQLNGFSHKVVYDLGTKESRVCFDEFSHCMPEGNWTREATQFFSGIGHAQYQNNAQEIIVRLPEER